MNADLILIVVALVALAAIFRWIFRLDRRPADASRPSPQGEETTPAKPAQNIFAEADQAVASIKQALANFSQAAKSLDEAHAVQQQTNEKLRRMNEQLVEVQANLNRQEKAMTQLAKLPSLTSSGDPNPRPADDSVPTDPTVEALWAQFIAQSPETDPTRIN